MNTQLSNFIKPVEWEPSYSMRTDVTKLIVAFRNFAHAHNRTTATL